MNLKSLFEKNSKIWKMLDEAEGQFSDVIENLDKYFVYLNGERIGVAGGFRLGIYEELRGNVGGELCIYNMEKLMGYDICVENICIRLESDCKDEKNNHIVEFPCCIYNSGLRTDEEKCGVPSNVRYSYSFYLGVVDGDFYRFKGEV